MPTRDRKKRTETPEETTVFEGEVIISEDIGGDPGGVRRLRVYATGGDYIIEIPSDARVTFGYFNPAAASEGKYDGMGGRGAQTLKATCLRVYEGAGDKNQIAAFLGVNGFRDNDKVKKTVLQQKVTIETNFEDDGIGNQVRGFGQKVEPLAIEESIDF